jgi:serine O-acetyltransferase
MSLDRVSDELLAAYLDPAASEMQHIGSYELPSEGGVERVVDLARALLFPGYAGPDVPRRRVTDPAISTWSDALARNELRGLVRTRLEELHQNLHLQAFRAHHHRKVQTGLHKEADCEECVATATEITDRFIRHLPELRELVRLDVRVAFQSDPAATGVDEILFCYPCTYAITAYRIAHALLDSGCVVIPRMMTEIAHRRTGIDIHPAADIGKGFFIDHGTGVVIGETTLIGDYVRIYQGVTLGALTVPQGIARPEKGVRRHPTIEDGAVIYANATILGGETIIGKGAVIGGNAFITASVAPGAKVTSSSRDKK